MKEYRIYYLENVKEKNIFYVGVTEQPLKKRLGSHWSQVKTDISCNKYKAFIMKNAKKEDITINEIETIFCTRYLAEIREFFWVVQFIRHGYKLTNKHSPGAYLCKYETNLGVIKRMGNINCPFDIFIYPIFEKIKKS